MKKIMILAMLLVSITCFGQAPVSYSKVLQCEGTDADDAYQRAELWLINTFSSPNKNVQMRDKESKTLVVKAATVFKSQKGNAGDINGYISYTLNLFFKDGRFKVDMIDLEHSGKKGTYNFGTLYDVEEPNVSIPFASKKWKSEIYYEMKTTAAVEFETICAILEKVVAKKIQSQDDNW